MFQNHDRKVKFQPGKFRWHFFLHYLHIKSVIVISSCYILLFLSATLWQKVNLHIHLYSHFTQNSVVNVNWHINKKKRNLTNNCQETKKIKKVFWGRGGLQHVAQGPLVILRHPWPSHTLDIIWNKWVYLGLIRPQVMVPVIHVLKVRSHQTRMTRINREVGRLNILSLLAPFAREIHYTTDANSCHGRGFCQAAPVSLQNVFLFL